MTDMGSPPQDERWWPSSARPESQFPQKVPDRQTGPVRGNPKGDRHFAKASTGRPELPPTELAAGIAMRCTQHAKGQRLYWGPIIAVEPSTV